MIPSYHKLCASNRIRWTKSTDSEGYPLIYLSEKCKWQNNSDDPTSIHSSIRQCVQCVVVHYIHVCIKFAWAIEQVCKDTHQFIICKLYQGKYISELLELLQCECLKIQMKEEKSYNKRNLYIKLKKFLHKIG